MLMFLLNFNSIKVRLERKSIRVSIAQQRFQFHKGAIRTISILYIGRSKGDFNSIKVRLEPRKVLGVDVLRIYGFVGAKIQKNLQKNVDA